MSRGFITIATGHERYFKMAFNLLKSYRLFSKNPLPFAILTDKHNQYTDEFDEVIILDNAKCSYMDKLSLLINCPYDETIFIDADCLAYHDLNDYWKIYNFSYPLSCFGNSFPLDNKHEGYFMRENIGKYKNQIKFIPHVHGGVYFIRKDEQCEKMYKLALDINVNYSKYKFNHFPNPADESILALCMAVFECRPIVEKGWHIIFYPDLKKFKADIFKGSNRCIKYGEQVSNAYLIHWSNFFTNWSDYKSEVDKLNVLCRIKVKSKITTNLINIDYYTKIKLDLKKILYMIVDFFRYTYNYIYMPFKSKIWKLIHN